MISIVGAIWYDTHVHVQIAVLWLPSSYHNAGYPLATFFATAMVLQLVILSHHIRLSIINNPSTAIMIDEKSSNN